MELMCQRCGYEWNYTGHREYQACCPNCSVRVSLHRTLAAPLRTGGSAVYSGLGSPGRRLLLRNMVAHLTNDLTQRGAAEDLSHEALEALLDSYIVGVDRALEAVWREQLGGPPSANRFVDFWRSAGTNPLLLRQAADLTQMFLALQAPSGALLHVERSEGQHPPGQPPAVDNPLVLREIPPGDRGVGRPEVPPESLIPTPMAKVKGLPDLR